jgi:hypothetical protein
MTGVYVTIIEAKSKLVVALPIFPVAQDDNPEGCRWPDCFCSPAMRNMVQSAGVDLSLV